jgi:hypothetical protein
LIAISLAVGTFAGTSFGRGSGAVACPREQPKAAGSTSAIAQGRGLAAAVGRSIVMVGDDERRQAFTAPSVGGAVVRHVASSPGLGTAYVEDRRGSDVVVVVDARGVTRLPQSGEATQPAWSSEGRLAWSVGPALRVWPGAGRATASIAAPSGAAAIFSPVFTGEDRITAVVSMSTPGAVTEDGSSDDLWTYDLLVGAWARLTRFPAGGDRWTAIRTPMLRSDGSLEFVRVTGDASATTLPRSSLWRIAGGQLMKLRDLSGEKYLAGTIAGRRVWNVFDSNLGDWRLEVERARGGFADLGCGRVMVDPRAELDPDRGPAARDVASPTPDPTGSPTPEPTGAPSPTGTPTTTPSPGTPTTTPSPGTIVSPTEAVLVGDFATYDEAVSVGGFILAGLGDGTTVAVVDSSVAPAAIMPGVWAVVMPIPADQDPVSALMSFRARLPQYAGNSWVVSL